MMRKVTVSYLGSGVPKDAGNPGDGRFFISRSDMDAFYRNALNFEILLGPQEPHYLARTIVDALNASDLPSVLIVVDGEMMARALVGALKHYSILDAELIKWQELLENEELEIASVRVFYAVQAELDYVYMNDLVMEYRQQQIIQTGLLNYEIYKLCRDRYLFIGPITSEPKAFFMPMA